MRYSMIAGIALQAAASAAFVRITSPIGAAPASPCVASPNRAVAGARVRATDPVSIRTQVGANVAGKLLGSRRSAPRACASREQETS